MAEAIRRDAAQPGTAVVAARLSAHWPAVLRIASAAFVTPLGAGEMNGTFARAPRRRGTRRGSVSSGSARRDRRSWSGLPMSLWPC